MSKGIEKSHGEVVIYITDVGDTKIDVRFIDDTVWLSQVQLCKLYQTSKSNISKHIKHIFEENELNEESVVRNFRTTSSDGKNYNILHYNLDMIISLVLPPYKPPKKIPLSFWLERFTHYIIYIPPI